MFELAGYSANHIPVFLNDHSHPHRTDILEEALLEITLPSKGFIRETLDMGREIGFTHCVEVSPTDEVFYMTRDTRPWKSTFVEGIMPQPTRLFTVILYFLEGNWFVATAFDGPLTPRDPADPTLTTALEQRESAVFWASHALVPTREEYAQAKAEGLI